MNRQIIVSLLTIGLLAGCQEQGAQLAAPVATSPADLELLAVAERGDLSALDALLGRRGTADVRDQCQWTPLMKAALNGHLDLVQRLLAAGAQVDAADTGGYTALLLAASNGHPKVVAALLDAGAMIDHQERTEGVTALIWAAKRGHRETVELLLARGADPSLPDLQGRSADEYLADGSMAGAASPGH